MLTNSLRGAVSLAALTFAAAATPALAQSRQVLTPNIATVDAQTSVTLNGTVFVNRAIQGAGRLDANIRDFRGDTLGSFSGMAIDLGSWRRNGDGSYAGSIYTLPDRGPLDGAIDYRTRVHTHDITFRPLAAGSAALPQTAGSQSQLTITPTGGFMLKDALGLEMTGRDPGNSTVTRGGIVYPLATDGTAAGRISLDPEAIAFRPDGSFYVSDEYAAGIYHFDATGRQIGAIQTVPALLSRTGGAIDFNSIAAPTTGRRNNQGLEAMALTPDYKKLVTILQSATVQDTAGAQQQTRNNTRILVYDVTGTSTPANPVGHYVLQLPVFNNNGSGGAADRTAAQSEMLALNDTQFLVLSRDGIGRGTAANASTSPTPVFKSVLLVDTTGATNLAGTAYETGVTPLATGGTLAAGIVPVRQAELVNLLNTPQLARVGMNVSRLPVTNATTVSEKWEAMALAPVLEEAAPQDFFLFVGNDNDFQATAASFNGTAYALGAADGTGSNDSVMLVYRLTLPTYVDSAALAALNATAPHGLYLTRSALTMMGLSTTQPAMRFLNAQRGFGVDETRRVQLWADGEWNRVRDPSGALRNISLLGFTMGVDVALGVNAHIGGFGGYRTIDHGGFDVEAWTAGAYAGIELPVGLYAQASVAWLGGADFKLRRASAYRQTALGETAGDGWATSGEIGWLFGPEGGLRFGPFAAVDYTDLKLNGYTERDASISNLTFAAREFRKLNASLGLEASTRIGAIVPALRGGYSFEREEGDTATVVRLAAAQHAIGTVTLPLAETERDSAFAELRLGMRDGPLSGHFAAKGRWGRGNDDARITIGLGYAF